VSGFTRRVPQLGLGRRRPRALTSWAPIASSAPMRQTRSMSPCSWPDESARRVGGRAPGVLGMGVLVDAEGYRPLACQNVRLLRGHARLKIGHAGGLAARSGRATRPGSQARLPRLSPRSAEAQRPQPSSRHASRSTKPIENEVPGRPLDLAQRPLQLHTRLSNALSPFRQRATFACM
jgi:hypothetical protein